MAKKMEVAADIPAAKPEKPKEPEINEICVLILKHLAKFVGHEDENAYDLTAEGIAPHIGQTQIKTQRNLDITGIVLMAAIGSLGMVKADLIATVLAKLLAAIGPTPLLGE